MDTSQLPVKGCIFKICSAPLWLLKRGDLYRATPDEIRDPIFMVLPEGQLQWPPTTSKGY